VLDGRVCLALASRGAAHVVLGRQTAWEQVAQGGEVAFDLFNLSLQRCPDFDTFWAHVWKKSNEFNGLNWKFRQKPQTT